MSRVYSCDWCGGPCAVVALHFMKPIGQPWAVQKSNLCAACEQRVLDVREQVRNPLAVETCARCGESIATGESLVLLGGPLNKVYHAACVR